MSGLNKTTMVLVHLREMSLFYGQIHRLCTKSCQGSMIPHTRVQKSNCRYVNINCLIALKNVAYCSYITVAASL
jgi:hypothetical protein